MKRSVIGIFAHVDAGKTTFSEALLYKSGVIRNAGRVDDKNTLLDTHELEKKRGITIFAGQADFKINDMAVTLLDTPGHVDFSAETERIMQVIDTAVLVISGTECVQSHTRTLWKMLEYYGVPVILFVTKTDYGRKDYEEITAELKKELHENCISFTGNENLSEEISLCDENVLNKYLESGKTDKEDIVKLFSSRKLFPCVFGSGLKMTGIDEFKELLYSLTPERIYPKEFGAKVFKITHDKNGNKLTHIKVTGGELKVRDTVKYGDNESKVSAIKTEFGEKSISLEKAEAGSVCTVSGLEFTSVGTGLGFEEHGREFLTEPCFNYRVVLPEETDVRAFFPKLKLLEEEDPQLAFSWNSALKEISVGLMGEVQTEIIKSIIHERFGVSVNIDNGRVMYKETVKSTVEGVGHYEPLRHYAEVHLIIEPNERGKGVSFNTKCREDLLDGNYQRLILTHLKEKQHSGVLTGSPLTDVKITLASGRAHQKHTEGGDFRQATYRAVRQGLMKAESVLLEPYYKYRLYVPREQLGRAINDIRMKSGTVSSPEDSGELSYIEGEVPVIEMSGYMAEVSSYTGGLGRLSLTLCGYKECHNEKEVIEKTNYNPQADSENSPDSVFCAHGSGFTVNWNEVENYMHLESCLLKKDVSFEPALNRRNFSIDDKELEEIMTKEFGPKKLTQTLYRDNTAKKAEKETFYKDVSLKRYIIVDGYNVIFSWDELKSVAKYSLNDARTYLLRILSNFAAFTKCETVVVFDAYKVSPNSGEKYGYDNLKVVFTKENETADTYIEKLVSEIGKNEKVRVVTSDNLIQLSSLRFGVVRESSLEFYDDVKNSEKQITEILENLKRKSK